MRSSRYDEALGVGQPHSAGGRSEPSDSLTPPRSSLSIARSRVSKHHLPGSFVSSQLQLIRSPADFASNSMPRSAVDICRRCWNWSNMTEPQSCSRMLASSRLCRLSSNDASSKISSRPASRSLTHSLPEFCFSHMRNLSRRPIRRSRRLGRVRLSDLRRTAASCGAPS